MARRLRRFLGLLVFLLALALSSFVLFRGKYRPVIRSLAETQVKNATSDLTNDAIAKQIAAGNIAYDRIVYFEKDLNGRITALKTNIGEINRLKTDILNIIRFWPLTLRISGSPWGACFCRSSFLARAR